MITMYPKNMHHKILTHQNAYIINELSQCYHNRDLVLFTGAGVSKGCGLPNWNELQTEMLKVIINKYSKLGENNEWKKTRSQHVEDYFKSISPLVKGRYLKRKLGKGYLKTLRSLLYKKLPNPSPTLHAVSKLADIRAVCTYNYDDLLETQPNPSRTFCPVAEPLDVPNNQIPVYHVHGFIPLYSYSNSTSSGDVIFSEEDYHRLYNDACNWSNFVQLTVLRKYSALLVGMSLSDPNLRRLLDKVKDENTGTKRVAICLYHDPPNPLDDMSHFITKIDEEESLASIGLTTYWVHDYDKDIPLLLNSIAAADPIRYYIRGVLKNLEPQSDICDSIETCYSRDCSNKALKGQLFCPDHYRRKMICEYIGLPVAVQYLDNDTLNCFSDEDINKAWDKVHRSPTSDPLKGFKDVINRNEQSTTADTVIRFNNRFNNPRFSSW